MSENNIEIEELKNSLKSALHEVSVPLKEIDFTRENYNKLFPYSKVNSPIETVKLGANQFEKLEKNERQKILQAVHDTLATPDVIINEEKEDVFGEKENSHLYAKSYIIDDKIHGIQSVVVSIDGENVSISTHERDINNIVNKIKKPDQLLYAAAEVRLLIERATGKQLVTVNPNRDSEYVVSPTQNISQNQTLSTSTAKTEYDTKRKIYLSGKITGDEGFAEKFKAKEEELTERGDYVFNPALHPDMFTHGQFMQIDLLALSFCDSIYLMDNWRESKGAKMEFEQAKVLGLDVEFEKEPYILLGAVGYYSDKSDEFDISDVADISADDMFGTKEEADKARNRLLHKEAGNVQILPASEVFGKRKNISFEQMLKNEKDISKLQSALQTAIEGKATELESIEPLEKSAIDYLNYKGNIEATRGTFRLEDEDRWRLLKDKSNLNKIAATLNNPDIVLKKESFDENSEEFKPFEIFGKNFKNKEGKTDFVVAYHNKGTVTVGFKGKNLTQFVKQIRNAEEISYVRPDVSREASMILSKGKQQPPSLEQSEKINENVRHVSLALGNLFSKFKEKNGFEPTNMLDGDYLRLSHTVISHSINNGTDYYDIMNSNGDIVCMDGETCEVVSHMHGEYTLQEEATGIPFVLSDEEFEYASQKIDLTKSLDNKEERYAPESFIRDVQEAIAPNPYMSDAGIIQTAKDILFERDIALGLEDSRKLSGLNPTDYTAKERDEINEALIALGGTQNIVDILKNTDPTDVKPLMDGRKQFETLLDKEGIKHSTNNDGTYKLDCGSVIFNTTEIIWHHPKYPAEQTIGPHAYIDMKNPKRTAELVQLTVQGIAKYKNQLIEKKSAKKQQDREVER